jgi:hypothetical protein
MCVFVCISMWLQTFLVTAAVTGGDGRSMSAVVRETYAAKGIRGFYPGGSAVALRQATNWASRQGLTEGVRISWRKRVYGSPDAQLTPNEEILCGVVGGAVRWTFFESPRGLAVIFLDMLSFAFFLC